MKSARILFIAMTSCLILFAGSAWATTIYNSIPSPLPGNVPSLGYQATQTSEFGDYIGFAGTDRKLTTVTFTMSTWAVQSDWQHPITFNLYNANTAGPTTSLGSLIATMTQTVDIPWLTEAWKEENEFSGKAFNVTFDFSSQNIILPDSVIFGIAFNTNTWGSNPLGVHGPYESLNYGLNDALLATTVGTDIDPDAVFWNTATAGWYADGGPGGSFRLDTNWSGYVPAVQFNAASAVPEPSTFALFGLAVGLGGLVAARKRLARQ